MSRNARVATAILALAVAVIAFVALRPDDASKSDTRTATQPSSGSTTTTATEPAAATPRPKPRAAIIRVENGMPVGGVKEITVKQGGTIRFTVVSDAAEQVHVHGYDVEKAVGPGEKARFAVPATITGVFEVELENAGVQIVKLTVEP